MKRSNLIGVAFCIALVMSLGLSRADAANRYYWSWAPDTIQVGRGDSFEWHLMLEHDYTAGLLGYGFSSEIDYSGHPSPPFDTVTIDWAGTAADLVPFPTRGFDYTPSLYAFGGYALEMACPPQLDPGTYIAAKVKGTIRTDAEYGFYTWRIPYPANPCAVTDCGNVEHEVPGDPDFAVFEVVEHTLGLTIEPPCPVSIPELETTVLTIKGTDNLPHIVTITASGLEPWMTLDGTPGLGPDTVVYTLTCIPPATAGDPSGVDYPVTFYLDCDAGGHLEAECVIHVENTVVGPAFELEFKKVLATPGEQQVYVPVFLTNRDPVGSFNVLVSFDPTAVSVRNVYKMGFPTQEYWDCVAEEWVTREPSFNEDFYPEYFYYDIGAYGHENWVLVSGIMDMDWPQDTMPPIPPSVQDPIFALVCDVNPLYEGQEIFFRFVFWDCGSNILTDPSGYTIYGPGFASDLWPYKNDLPAWLDCNYEHEVGLIDGNDGCAAIGIRGVLVGDLNCNEMQCEIGDAQVFVNYLVEGDEALCGMPCQDMYGYPDCYTMQAKASDMDGNGYYFTIADLIQLLNCVHGITPPPQTASVEPVDVILSGSSVSLNSDVSVGAAYFVVDCKGEVGTPKLEIPGMDLKYSVEDGIMKLVIFSFDAHSIPAGSHTLFTIPGAEEITIKTADLADVAGNTLSLNIFHKVAPDFGINKIVPNPVRDRSADIFFSIPATGKVSLKVYDSAGRLVTTLVDGVKQSGFYKETWDARDLGNGVYFCRLEGGKLSTTRKIVLMK